MLAKRLIPCLDVDAGRVVKGVQFQQLRDAGDPVKVAASYSEDGADEIAVLDISASREERKTMINLVDEIASSVFIPLMVGGGISELEDINQLLRSGADKVSINTAAVLNPPFVKEAVDAFGSQCIVAAIDAKRTREAKWEVFIYGGKEATGFDALEWIQQLNSMGVGEILLTSMDQDGKQSGFDLELTKKVSEMVKIPVIASGGVGTLQHLVDGVKLGQADAVLAASIFHFGTYTIKEAKRIMQQAGIEMRST